MKHFISKISKVLLIATILPIATIRAELPENVNEDQTRACCNRVPRISCAPTPITTVTTITTAGTYCLANTISGAGPLITIASSSVVLDLNSFVLNATSGNAVVVDPTLHRDHITIRNGLIDGSAAGDPNTASGANGIVIPTPIEAAGFGHSCVLLSNLDIRRFVSTGMSTGPSFTSASHQPVNNMTIDNCCFIYSGTNISLAGANISITNSKSEFSISGNGAYLNSCDAIRIEDSIFSFNALAGVVFNSCGGAIVNNSIFFSNSGDGFDAVQTNPLIALFGDVFEQCLFSGNGGKGVYINSPVLEGGCFKFLECESLCNSDNGFTFSGIVTDVVLEQCISTGNCPGNGFVFTTAAGCTATLTECAASDNTTGFDMSASLGSGVIQGCKAIGNSLTVSAAGCTPAAGGCGFNDTSTSLYQYVSNVAQGNGSGAASGTDTNYCVSGVGSEFTPVTGGPGITMPYNQYGRNQFGFFAAGLSAFDNVTLR